MPEFYNSKIKMAFLLAPAISMKRNPDNFIKFFFNKINS